VDKPVDYARIERIRQYLERQRDRHDSWADWNHRLALTFRHRDLAAWYCAGLTTLELVQKFDRREVVR
jgi:hypothetical protein